MSRRLRIVLGVVLAVVAALLLVALTPINRPAEPWQIPLPYAARGPFAVGLRDMQTGGDDPLDLTLWYPAAGVGDGVRYRYAMKTFLGQLTVATYTGQAATDAPFDRTAEPHPLVILSPGFSITGASYAWLAEHLASHGFVVVSPEHSDKMLISFADFWRAPIDRPHDILEVLATIDVETAPGGSLAGVVDPETVAVMGHSYGGYTTLAAGGARWDTVTMEARCAEVAQGDPEALLCNNLIPYMGDMAARAGLDSPPDGLWPAVADPRIDALVPVAGDSYFFNEAGLAEITIPVMAIGGTADMGTPWLWGAQPTYDYASSARKVLIGLEGAEHMIFAGPCERVPRVLTLAEEQFCVDPAWERGDAHPLVAHFATAFLLAELLGDGDAAAALALDAVDLPAVLYEAQGY
jgi:predicted dienelactone hydrolase